MSRILVIDDDEAIRGMLRRALETVGHEVFEARNGRQGADTYWARAIDLVITDILMPDRDGLECLLELRCADRDVRVIAISGGGRFHTLDVLEIARRLGARRTFWKPFDLAKLVVAVESELQDRRAA